MTVRLSEVISHLDETLEIGRFRDYGPNGLQVEGRPDVRRIVTAVSANLETFERACTSAKANANDTDLIVVHHGLIWGRGISRIVGTAANRLRYLLSNGISLAAYHLPLDAHPALGNNAGLADAIGLEASGRRGFGDVRGHALGLAGTLAEPMTREAAIEHIGNAVGNSHGSSLDSSRGAGSNKFAFPYGPDVVTTIGLCTGAASDLLEEAAQAGCDLFVTGELAERAGEVARELNITLVAAGHVATEVYGPQRLAAELRRAFPETSVEFIDVPSPL